MRKSLAVKAASSPYRQCEDQIVKFSEGNWLSTVTLVLLIDMLL